MLYELNARGCLIQCHVDQIRLRVDDHTPDDSNEIIPANKELVVPPMLPTNTVHRDLWFTCNCHAYLYRSN